VLHVAGADGDDTAGDALSGADEAECDHEGDPTPRTGGCRK
jgi:hypothetical protein